jgi:DNA replication protein DnaC
MPMKRCQWHPVEPVDCPVCSEQEKTRSSQREKDEIRRKEEIKQRFAAIGIGRRYAGVSFGDYQPVCVPASQVKAVCETYAATFPARLVAGDSLLMLGNIGTGKNMLAAAICHAVCQAGFTPVHTTAIRVIRRVREAWRKNAEASEQEMVDSFTVPDLLVVDEVGRQYGTDGENLILSEIFANRYDDKKPSILISNLVFADLEHYLGAHVLDRLQEGDSRLLEFNWGSYRVS